MCRKGISKFLKTVFFFLRIQSPFVSFLQCVTFNWKCWNIWVSCFSPLQTEVLYIAPVEIVVLLSVFYGTISLVAIVGNSLVIWVVATTRQMRTVTNMYIANLAFADVIIGLFCIPFQVSGLEWTKYFILIFVWFPKKSHFELMSCYRHWDNVRKKKTFNMT